MNENDLKILLRSSAPLMVLETFDEASAVNLLTRFFREAALPAWRWSLTEGLQPLGFGLTLKDPESYSDPEAMLKFVKTYRKPAAFVLCDFHHHFDEPKFIRYIKDIALMSANGFHRVIFVSYQLRLPPELSRYAVSIPVSVPNDEEILAIIREEARRWSQKNGHEKIKTDNESLDKLVNNLKGLPHQDVRRLAHGAIADDGAITEADLPEVTKAKFELMDMAGVLHYEFSTAHLREVAGLNVLKKWLEDRRLAARSESQSVQLEPPKGVLLFGVQGGGKSLAAKAIAGVWGLPLLRLDMAALFNKFVGETERNLREALKLANLMAPCVLWIDEIEKGMAEGAENSGTSKRLLGTLLTWMAERKAPVFMVATSNDISQLPPELIRKGRFDEIFFVDLPEHEVRVNIFRIHLEKRGLSPQDFDLGILATATEGFTGAEIEQAVVSAAYTASARACDVATELVLSAVQQTRPLSVVMAERIAQLRAWAAERAVTAN